MLKPLRPVALAAGALALVAGLLVAALPASAATGSRAGSAAATASLTVKVTDLPRGVGGTVLIKGPDAFKRDVTSTVTVSGLKPGTYAVSAASVRAGGTTYVPSVTGASVTLKAGQSATSTVAYYTQIPATTRPVAAGDVTSVAGSATGKQTVVLNGAGAVKAGDVVAVGTGPATPDGLLVKVTAVKASGQRQTLTTEPATLKQAIPQGSFSAAAALGQLSAGSTSLNGARPGAVVTCGAGGSVTTGWSLTSSVTTAFSASWSLLSGVTATATATASEASEVNASATAGASCTLTPLDVGPVLRKIFVGTIGPVPVVIVAKVQAVLNGSVSVSAAASASASQKFTATAGLKYSDGSISPIHDVSNVTSYNPPTVGATASLDVTVGPQVSLSFYGVGGPVINVDPGLNLTYNSDANPPWTLDAVLRAGVALTVPMLDFSVGDSDVIDLSYTLASGGTPKPNWGDALALAGDGATIDAIACPAPGDCSAGGYNSSNAGFLISEKDGIWGKPQFPGLEEVTVLSCASAHFCAAGGTDGAGDPFLATETDGVWGPPVPIPNLSELGEGGWPVGALSCAPAGKTVFCAAGGFYEDKAGNRQAYIVNGPGGVWEDAEEFPGTAALNKGGLASVNDISCVPAGKSAVCTAGGDYSPGVSSGGTVLTTGFVADETGGTWSHPLSLNVGLVTSLSCTAAGDCTAVGGYTDGGGNEQAFGVTESDGTWGTPAGIESPFGTGELFGVSCASPGNCAATGMLDVSQVKGTWGKAQPLTQGATSENGQMDAVSCSTTDYCVASGQNYSGFGSHWNPLAFVAADSAGTWAYATTVPGSAHAQGFTAACTPDGDYCAVGGEDDLTQTGAGNAFVSSATSTKATVELSSDSVESGAEGSEKVTVTIKAASGAEPTGTVFVTVGGSFTCQVTLKAGTGSCNLGARSLPAGYFSAIASYYGVPGFYGSTSEPSLLTVEPSVLTVSP